MGAEPGNLAIERGSDAGSLLFADVVVLREAVAGALQMLGAIGRTGVGAGAKHDPGPFIAVALVHFGGLAFGAVGDGDLAILMKSHIEGMCGGALRPPRSCLWLMMMTCLVCFPASPSGWGWAKPAPPKVALIPASRVIAAAPPRSRSRLRRWSFIILSLRFSWSA